MRGSIDDNRAYTAYVCLCVYVYSDGLFVFIPFIRTLYVANYKYEEKLLNYEGIFLKTMPAL